MENGVLQETNEQAMETIGAVRPPEGILHFARYLLDFGAHLEIRDHIAALRYLTFTALEIPHICCHPWVSCRKGSQEDAAEVADERKHELACLEELLAEFEDEVIAILQDPDRGIGDVAVFWEHTWVRRTWKAWSCLEGSDLGDEERREAEVIGVVWDRPQPPQPPEVPENPYDMTNPDYWMYELKKIEAECE